jgi:hypothetical protein
MLRVGEEKNENSRVDSGYEGKTELFSLNLRNSL